MYSKNKLLVSILAALQMGSSQLDYSWTGKAINSSARSWNNGVGRAALVMDRALA